MRSIQGSLEQLQPLVPVSIGSPDQPYGERETYTALIDTGATRTCITRRVVERFGLAPRSKLLVASATSTPERRWAYGYSLGLFCFNADGERTLYVLPFELIAPSFQDNANFDVLLGMDVLSRGRLLFERSAFSFTFDF